MSDSVGKISLDLEVTSDLQGQISKVSNSIGNGLKNALNKSTGKVFDDMEKNLNKNTKVLGNNLVKTTNKFKTELGKAFKSVANILKNAKMPEINFQKPSNANTPKNATTSNVNKTRGSPVNESIKAAMETTSAELDIVNAKIEQQQAKLSMLRETYENTFSTKRKNKLEEQILKTESAINKLIARSDKLGFKLADMDSKVNSTASTTSKLSNNTKLLDNKIKSANNSSRSYSSSIGMIARSMLTWGIIFPTILKGLTAMATGLYNNLMTNAQFANSLAQIKTNLMVAFTPIYQAILPALNALMSALAKATQYIASFISSIFGKTYQQSYNATQSLIDAKVAMGAYGDATEKAGKQAKKAQDNLMGFDEINKLQLNDDTNNDSSGVNDKIPTLVAPPLDTTSVDNSMNSLTDKIKAWIDTFDFQPLIKQFNNLKSAVTPIINNLGKIIKWFLVEILNPLAHWTIEDALPAFFRVLAGVLKVLNPILEAFMEVGNWLWKEFLQPIASWTGDLIVKGLNALANILERVGKWLSEHKPIVEDFILVLGSFALAWVTVTGAIKLFNGVVTLTKGIMGGLSAAFSFLTSPIGLVILAIGSVIAIGVLLYKHWDELKEKCGQVWDWIKEKFTTFKDWLGSVFATDWTKWFGVFGDVINAFFKNIKNIWDAIKEIFGGIIDFIAGVFTGDWERAFKGLASIVEGIFNGLVAVVKSPINLIIGLVNGLITGLNKIKMPDWVPSIGGKGINIPKIPYLAKGGVVNQPTLSMIGEAGREAVVPLENNTGWIDEIASKLGTALIGANNINNSNKTGGDLILQLDGQTAGRLLNPYIKGDNGRIGVSKITSI